MNGYSSHLQAMVTNLNLTSSPAEVVSKVVTWRPGGSPVIRTIITHLNLHVSKICAYMVANYMFYVLVYMVTVIVL